MDPYGKKIVMERNAIAFTANYFAASPITDGISHRDVFPCTYRRLKGGRTNKGTHVTIRKIKCRRSWNIRTSKNNFRHLYGGFGGK